ncbi:hypothetical protein ACFVS2_23400 [Brevibacillus sp. NPDC058079]|uniref:hypothetical protein n=1 Tax=Brevibacillus sp. NPDC058079 TaxID=3346330 RepID=UPI0036E23781
MNYNFKKIIASALAFAVLTLSASSIYAEKLPDSENLVDNFSYEREIKGENNNVIGVVKTDVTREVKVEEDGTKVITLEKDIVEDYNEGEDEERKKVDEFIITASGEYYLNGEKLSEEFLNQTYTGSENTLKASYNGVSGGYLAEYDEISKDYYKLESYKTTNFFLDRGSAKTYTSTYVGEENHAADIAIFVSKADGVEDARDQVSLLTSALAAELGIAVLTVSTVIGAIAAGGAAAITASELVDASNDGLEDLEDAYNIIKNI